MKTMPGSPIVKAARCLINGKAVLMGYDKDNRELYGIGIDTKKPVAWACHGVSSTDLPRLQRDYANYQDEWSTKKC